MPSVPYWRLSAWYFAYFAFVGAFSPYFSLYLQSRQFSAWDIGVLMSQMQIMRVLAPNLWGWVAERSGRRVPVVQWAAGLSVLAFAVVFVADGFVPMLLALGALGFFWSAALPLVETLTFDHLDRQSSRYGSIRLWGSVGFILAVMGLGPLLDHFGIHSLPVWTLLVLIGIAASARALPEAASHATDGVSVHFRDLLRKRPVQALLLSCFLMAVAHAALYVFYSIHLVDHGYSKGMVGLMWSLGVVAEIVVFWRMSWLIRRFGLRKLLLASFGLAAIRFVAIGWGADWLWLLLIAQLMHAATFGVHHAASVAAIREWFPGRSQARGQALYTSVSFGVGGLTGGLLAGALWDHAGATWVYTISAVAALAGGYCVARGLPHKGSLEED